MALVITKEWTLNVKCDYCLSEVIGEREDIKHCSENGDFYFECPLCGKRIVLERNELPAFSVNKFSL